jgi:hypothetical protein
LKKDGNGKKDDSGVKSAALRSDFGKAEMM